MNQLPIAHESSLLLTLEEISQLVSHSHDPGETLANIVRLIQERFQTDVCSVYLLEPEQAELVLGATVGLKPESVGRVRMQLEEGLTGLVAQKLAPVMVADAFKHPRFKYFPEAGEDPYHAFLGVPLVEGGVLQGVLVVQTAEPRSFSSNETRMLVTVGAQLAPLVSEAHLLERILAAVHEPASSPAQTTPPSGPAQWHGSSLSPGVGVGQVYVVDAFAEWPHKTETRSVDFDAEKQRLHQAIVSAQEEITRLSQQISALVGEDHGAILQAQLLILQDRTIEQDLMSCIAAGSTAESAMHATLGKYVAAFQKLTNPFFQERVYDIKDVFRRIYWYLQPRPAQGMPATEGLVLVAHEASVTDLFSVDLVRLAGMVVEKGGPQSHAAILARSLGVPMVGQVAECVSRLRHGGRVLVNANTGVVYLNPSEDELTSQEMMSTRITLSMSQRSRETVETKPRVEANVNLLYEVNRAVEQQACGVGLYRSEFLFLARRTLPTEEEQVDLYQKLLERLHGRPASIRTFDIRPDKLAHYSHLTLAAAHPFDWRLVLDSPPVQKLFKEQVRAILRAAKKGPARILVPMLTRTEQLDFVLATIQEAKEELQRDGLEFEANVPLGIMIEVAAAIALVGGWSSRVDFVALGTNDLVSSALGIDRDDPIGSSRNDPLHPGVLHLINAVVKPVQRAGKQVTVCGEMAADPEGLLALAALGVDSVSVPVNQLGAVRGLLVRWASQKLNGLSEQILSQRTSGQTRDLLQSWTAKLK